MAEKNKITEVTSEHWEPDLENHIYTSKAIQLVWLLVSILDGILALRFLLKLFAANPSSPIAAIIYSFTSLFLTPFKGLTVTPSAGGISLEIPTLFAILIYTLLGWVVVRLIGLIFYRPGGSMVNVTKTRTHEDQRQRQGPENS